MTDLVLSTGASMHMDYDLAGNMLAMRDGNGNVIQSYIYGPGGLVWSETDSTGTTTYDYDAYGNVIKSTDSDGKATLMEYFASGLLKRMVEDNGTPDDVSDDEVSTFTYDKLGREQKADYGNGIYVEYGYEGSGGDWMTLDAPTIGHLERKMTADGKLAGWVTADGGTPTFIYDQAGRLWKETDALGNVTTEYGYDAAGRLTSTKDVTTGAIATKQYDAGNRVTEEVDPLGRFTRYEYDNPRNGGKLKSVTNGKYVQDEAGNWVVDTTVTLQTTRFEYNGLSTTVIDALGRRTTSVMDAYSLPLETIFEQRDGQDYRTSTSYLYANNLQEAKDYPTRTVDIGGNDRVFTYDDLGRLKTATDLGDGLYTYAYGDDGLSQITGPTGETLQYGYDDLGNLSRVTYGDNSSKQLAYYETDNRLKSVTLPSTENISYVYDNAGRVTAQTTSTGLTTCFTYDANGTIKTVTDNTGTTTYHYDAQTGALSEIDHADGSSIAYTYNVLGRVKTETEKGSLTGLAYTTEYGYDAFGNLNWVKDPTGGITTMIYDGGNRLQERKLPNGITTTYEYDGLDRVKSIVHKNAEGEVLASMTYEREGIGEPTKITREDGSSVKLQYDAALRVTKESYYNAAGTLVDESSYAYDAAGKRIAQVTAVGNQTYTYTPGYQLDSIQTATGTEDYDYDANGRLAKLSRDGATLDLDHDVYDRLTQVTNETTGRTIQYTYDGQGHRVAATEGGQQRKFLVTPGMGGLDTTDLVTDGSGNLISNYVYAGGTTPFMRLDANGNPVYYLSDGMGSVIGLADSTGHSTAKFGYDAFGNVRSSQGVAADATGGDFRFQGQWLESATGIYNFRAREYDSRTGTFLSCDPVDPNEQQPEAFNPYQAMYNNPYVYSDPSGMFTIGELNAAEAADKILEGIQTSAKRELGQRIKDKAIGVGTDVINSILKSFLPFDAALQGFQLSKGLQEIGGTGFEGIVSGAICRAIGAEAGHSSFLSALWFEPSLNLNGQPAHSGYNYGGAPSGRNAASARNVVQVPNDNGGLKWANRADLIVSKKPPVEQDARGYLIADFKTSVNAISPYNDSNNQWRAMMNYAQHHQYVPVALFITLFGEEREGQEARRQKEALEHHGVFLRILSLFDKK